MRTLLPILILTCIIGSFVQCGGGKSGKGDGSDSGGQNPAKLNFQEVELSEGVDGSIVMESDAAKYMLEQVPANLKPYTVVLARIVNPITGKRDKKCQEIETTIAAVKPAEGVSLISGETVTDWLKNNDTIETPLFDIDAIKTLCKDLNAKAILMGDVIASNGYVNLFLVDVEHFEVIAAFTNRNNTKIKEISKEALKKVGANAGIGVTTFSNAEADGTPSPSPVGPYATKQITINDTWGYGRIFTTYLANFRKVAGKPIVIHPMAVMEAGVDATTIEDSDSAGELWNQSRISHLVVGNYALKGESLYVKVGNIALGESADLFNEKIKYTHPAVNAQNADVLGAYSINQLRIDSVAADVAEKAKQVVDLALEYNKNSLDALEAQTLYYKLKKDEDNLIKSAEALSTAAKMQGESKLSRVADYYRVDIMFERAKTKNEPINVRYVSDEPGKGFVRLYDKPLLEIVEKETTFYNDKKPFNIEKATGDVLANVSMLDDPEYKDLAFKYAMIIGKFMFASKNWDPVAQFYERAIKLAPADDKALRGYASARIALAKLYGQARGFARSIAETIDEESTDSKSGARVPVDPFAYQQITMMTKMMNRPMDQAGEYVQQGYGFLEESKSHPKYNEYYTELLIADAESSRMMGFYFALLSELESGTSYLDSAIEAVKKIPFDEIKQKLIERLEFEKSKLSMFSPPKKEKKE